MKKNTTMVALAQLLILTLITEYSFGKPIYTVMEVLQKESPETLHHKYAVVYIYKPSDEDSQYKKELMAPV